MTWVAVGVGAVSLVSSGVKAIGAGKAEKRAKAEGDALRRPFAKVEDEYFQNKNIAEQQAVSGLNATEKGNLQDQRGEAFGSSIDALSRTGGSPNDFSKVISLFNDSLKNEAGLDSQKHAENIDYFMKANADLAGQKTTQWALNEYQPFESQLKSIQDRRAAAITNKNNAINEGVSSLAALSTSINSAVKPGEPAEPGKKVYGSVNPVTTELQDSNIDRSIDVGGSVSGSPQEMGLTFNQ